MSLGKIMLAISIFSYFLTSDALDFVVLILNYFPSQKRLCSLFCSCKTLPCTEFCGCAPYALRFVPTKSLCTTPPPYLRPDRKINNAAMHRVMHGNQDVFNIVRSSLAC